MDEITIDLKKLKNMDMKKALLWGAIALLGVAVIYTTFFKGSISSAGLGANAGQAASAYSGMVGGC